MSEPEGRVGKASPLKVRAFRLLAGGQFASTIGDYCYAVALPWFVLSDHGSSALLGTVLACYGLPRTLLIPVGGVLADRIGPRRLMMVADLVRFALVVVLTVLATRHSVSLVTLGPTAALIGAGEGLFIPASFAIMPSLVDAEQLAAGNAISSAAVQAGSLIGPAIGGALVAATGASTAAFGVDAASFAVSVITLALIPGRRRTSAPEEGAPGSIAQLIRSGGGPSEIDCAIDTLEEGPGGEGGSGDAGATAGAATPEGEGAATPESEGSGGSGVSGAGSQDAGGVLNLLRRSRALQVILVVVIAANLAGGGMGEVALPALAHAHYGAAGYGALLACLAAGAIAGTLTAARSGRLRKPVLFAGCLYLIEAAAICLIPYLGGEPGAAAALLVMGITNGLGNTVFLTVTQKEVPQRLLGRVMAAVMLCAFGSFPLSVAVTGILVRHIGPAPFFPIAGGVLAVAIALGLTSRDFRNFGGGVPMPL